MLSKWGSRPRVVFDAPAFFITSSPILSGRPWARFNNDRPTVASLPSSWLGTATSPMYFRLYPPHGRRQAQCSTEFSGKPSCVTTALSLLTRCHQFRIHGGFRPAPPMTTRARITLRVLACFHLRRTLSRRSLHLILIPSLRSTYSGLAPLLPYRYPSARSVHFSFQFS